MKQQVLTLAVLATLSAPFVANATSSQCSCKNEEAQQITPAWEEAVESEKTDWSQVTDHNRAMVTAEKLYFHAEPKAETKTKPYIVEGDEVRVIKASGDYVMVLFVGKNPKEKTKPLAWVYWVEASGLTKI